MRDRCDSQKRRFIETLSVQGTVYHSAQAAGISRQTAYRWRQDDPDFTEYQQTAHGDPDAPFRLKLRRGVMQDFNVYPKKGKPFIVCIEGYERAGNKFLVYDQTRQISNDGFLNFNYIAAIVPQNLHKRSHYPQVRDSFDFRVYLRSGEQFDINADFCDTSDPETIIFAFTNTRPSGPDRYDIENLYIAPSEVVAIMPPDGLIYRS